LLNYGQNEAEAKVAAKREHRRIYDGHSLCLSAARPTFDIICTPLKNTKVLYVQSPTDKLFDIALSPGYVSDMRKSGINVTYVELPSNKGHMASHADAALWAPILGAFMKGL
jgi:homoserine O-acetyltransferase